MILPVTELLDLVGEARALSAGLSREEMTRRPASGGWSVAECLEHLNVTNRLYSAVLKKAIADGRARKVTGDGDFRLTLLERLFVWIVGPPPRLKVKAPPPFQPGDATDPEAIIAEWESLHCSLSELADEANGLHLTKLRVVSPASEAIKISLLAGFHLIVAHDRRHILQARRVRESI